VFSSQIIEIPLLLEPFEEQNFYHFPMTIARLVDIAVSPSSAEKTLLLKHRFARRPFGHMIGEMIRDECKVEFPSINSHPFRSATLIQHRFCQGWGREYDALRTYKALADRTPTELPRNRLTAIRPKPKEVDL
jgi:hypothetical protein